MYANSDFGQKMQGYKMDMMEVPEGSVGATFYSSQSCKGNSNIKLNSTGLFLNIQDSMAQFSSVTVLPGSIVTHMKLKE